MVEECHQYEREVLTLSGNLAVVCLGNTDGDFISNARIYYQEAFFQLTQGLHGRLSDRIKLWLKEETDGIPNLRLYVIDRIVEG